jgi:predicted nucleotide-binding protein
LKFLIQNAVQIEKVFDVFERNLIASKLPAPALPSPQIFIGHGRSLPWRDLKDHLTDKHGYSVTAYEVGARAGHTIRDILDDMLTESSFALLVMTGEDETITGDLRSRQNVVHELGLFQGKLGFSRAIAIAEKEVELFSNIDGVQQLRFSAGNIAEVYGDVLATLRREFGYLR